MADVEVQMQFTAEKKVRKVKKTKRRESDVERIDSEVTITDISEKENHVPFNDQGYVLQMIPD